MRMNMTYRDTQSQVQSEQKAGHVRVAHRVLGFSIRPKEA